MKVKIDGIVRIKQQGKVLYEIKNNINFTSLLSVLYKVFTNSPPSGSSKPTVYMEGIYVTMTYSNFVWTGTFSLIANMKVTSLLLYATFNGFQFLASQVNTTLYLSPGTYTIEWIWIVDDPVGLVKRILNFGFSGTYKSYSIASGTCTSLQSVIVQQSNITFLFSCFETTSTTYTNFTITFDTTNSAGTTYVSTTTLPFALQFKLNAPNTLLVPFTIQFA
ncbi:hypothetical protein SBFV1_gp42 [Sulfolobales Beppu filamentous phage 1]|uniref:Uncharacterized protein n=1 Tax=Sulfolobales Beppu filamentous phage 1 TaxID=2493122 RepID=A0A3S8NEQ8_9VIRU|nr:hypothetical protein SBFV1_gp42 [Sulfolobales Beppu filamentous phage 1]